MEIESHLTTGLLKELGKAGERLRSNDPFFKEGYRQTFELQILYAKRMKCNIDTSISRLVGRRNHIQIASLRKPVQLGIEGELRSGNNETRKSIARALVLSGETSVLGVQDGRRASQIASHAE